MSRESRAVRDLSLVAAAMVAALVIVALSVANSIDGQVSHAVTRVGEVVRTAGQ